MKRTVRTTGFGSPAESYSENDIDWNKQLFPKPHAMYVFLVKGSGGGKFMLQEGDLAVIDCSLVPRSGDLIVHSTDGEFIIGEYTGKEREVTGVVSRLIRMYKA